jgi:hypothetical protein
MGLYLRCARDPGQAVRSNQGDNQPAHLNSPSNSAGVLIIFILFFTEGYHWPPFRGAVSTLQFTLA